LFEGFPKTCSSSVLFGVLLAGWCGVDLRVAMPAAARFRQRAMSSPRKRKSAFKCLNCNEICQSDPRNRRRQLYCAKPECRRSSKIASQRKWLGRPENQNYFRGAENCARVQRWRQANPGYWKKAAGDGGSTLQDSCKMQTVAGQGVTGSGGALALQEILIAQPALFVGLIAVITGSALQDDILAQMRRFVQRGEDILRKAPASAATSASVPNPAMYKPSDRNSTAGSAI
jgi:hypothetical protein